VLDRNRKLIEDPSGAHAPEAFDDMQGGARSLERGPVGEIRRVDNPAVSPSTGRASRRPHPDVFGDVRPPSVGIRRGAVSISLITNVAATGQFSSVTPDAWGSSQAAPDSAAGFELARSARAASRTASGVTREEIFQRRVGS